MRESLQKTTFLSVVAILIMGGVFFLGYRAGIRKVPEITKVTDLSNKTEGMPESIDFSAFWKAWNVVNDKFVMSVATSTPAATDQERVWGAIQGMTKALGDPYTVFFPPEDNKMFQNEISGFFEGIGIEIGIKDDILTVVAPLKGTPADKAGIMSGDKILDIDGHSTVDMNTDTAVQKIRGKQGTAVTLTLQRNGKPGTFDVKIIRGVINIPTISTQINIGGKNADVADAGGLRRDGVFVIKLYSFNAQSPSLFRDALRQFILSGSDKLLLDLRGNPGGYLEAAVDMASWFLPVGQVIVKEQYAKSDNDVIYRSRGYDVFNKNLKMVVLINSGSASASEILAGALREYGIARLVGTKSFGKGSVQELVPITPETSLKVTIARWVTPDGHSISLEGLQPDYLVEITQTDLTAGKDPQFDKAIQVLNEWK